MHQKQPDKKIQSISRFVSQIKNLPKFNDAFYAYRGEADKSWSTLPGIMRKDTSKLLEFERDAVRDIVSVHPLEFSDDLTMFDRLVRMQHFGLPTRLLDVTANPLVALFNACQYNEDESKNPTDGKVLYLTIPNTRRKYFDSDTISCVANLANLSSDEKIELFNADAADNQTKKFNDPKEYPACDRLLQFIRYEKPSFRPLIKRKELDMIWYVIPKLSNRRIIAQNGAFLIYGLTDRLKKPKEYLPLIANKFIIPHQSKSGIRTELATLGITESALFPEIDKAAKLIKRRYLT